MRPCSLLINTPSREIKIDKTVPTINKDTVLEYPLNAIRLKTQKQTIKLKI
jgi:hypothetical protein